MRVEFESVIVRRGYSGSSTGSKMGKLGRWCCGGGVVVGEEMGGDEEKGRSRLTEVYLVGW